MALYSFPKKEKLKHKRLFSQLFEQGHSKYIFPIRLLWIRVDPPISEVNFLCGVSVPKRLFPKAVHRNRIKRKLREAYRLNKPSITHQSDGLQYAILYIYTAREDHSSQKIHASMKQLTKFLHKQISHN